jgi:hypothetical protein
MKWFLIVLGLLALTGCTKVSVSEDSLLWRAAQAEETEHSMAAIVGEIQEVRSGRLGLKLDSVSNILSQHLGVSVWCFPYQLEGIHVARCSTQRRLDAATRQGGVIITYPYYGEARFAGISKPVFLDECYRCGRYRVRNYRHSRW